MDIGTMIALIVAFCCLQLQFGDCSFNIESLFPSDPLEEQENPTSEIKLADFPQPLSIGALLTPSKDGDSFVRIYEAGAPVDQIERLLNSPGQKLFTINRQGHTRQVLNPTDVSDMQSMFDTLTNELSPLTNHINTKEKVHVTINTDDFQDKPNENPSQINPTDSNNVATITIIGSSDGTSDNPQYILKETKTSTDKNVGFPKDPENVQIDNLNIIPNLFSDILKIHDANSLEPVTKPNIANDEKPSLPKQNIPFLDLFSKTDVPSLPVGNVLHINPTESTNGATITIIERPQEIPGTRQFVITETKTSTGPLKTLDNSENDSNFSLPIIPEIFSNIFKIDDANLIEPVKKPLITSEHKSSLPKLDTPLTNNWQQVYIPGFLDMEPTLSSGLRKSGSEQSTLGDKLNDANVGKSLNQEVANLFKNLFF